MAEEPEDTKEMAAAVLPLSALFGTAAMFLVSAMAITLDAHWIASFLWAAGSGLCCAGLSTLGLTFLFGAIVGLAR